MKIHFTKIFLSFGLGLIFSTSAFASEGNNINNSLELSTYEDTTYTLNLAEDNGEEYQEIIINPNLKASGTYETTYDTTGGVYTQQTWVCSDTPKFTVTIKPTSFAGASQTVTMGIKLQKKGALVYSDVDEDYVTLAKGGTVTVSGNEAGTYRLYFRNYSGFRATGKIYISFSY